MNGTLSYHPAYFRLWSKRPDGQETGTHGQVIPGVMVYAMAEGLLTYTMERTGMAFLHADFTVKGPTFVGDTISVEVEIIEARATSKPGCGLVRSRNRVLKVDGSECIIYEPLRMLRTRN